MSDRVAKRLQDTVGLIVVVVITGIAFLAFRAVIRLLLFLGI